MMWELINKNKRRSLWLFLLMGLILLTLGYLIGEYFFAEPHIGIIVALIIWAINVINCLFGYDSILKTNNAYLAPREHFPQLHNIVEEMIIAANMVHMPEIYIIPERGLNAFAIGVSPKKSAIIVSAGLLGELDRDELQGVIAHELSHIANRDTLFMTFAATLLGTVFAFSRGGTKGLNLSARSGRSVRYQTAKPKSKSKSKSSSNAGNVYLFLALLAFALISPILVRLLYYAISREREYLADASAARLTRYPEGLASALEKIALNNIISSTNKATAPLFIANPLATTFADKYNTHPPIFDRINILRKMAGGADYFNYQRAYRSVTRKREALIPASAIKNYKKIPLREKSPEAASIATAKETTLFNPALDFIRAMNDFIFVTCGCGLKMKVPPNFKAPTLKCPRCGKVNTIPGQKKSPKKTVPLAEAQAYIKSTAGWESFSCKACNNMINLSPLFKGTKVKCNQCGNEISVTVKKPVETYRNPLTI